MLVLNINAPMYSWGVNSTPFIRPTRPTPTRSAIIGLIGAALGLAPNELYRINVEIDVHLIKGTQAVTLNDFHTIGNGYSGEEAKKYVPKNISGGTVSAPLTNRYYVTNTRYIVTLNVTDGEFTAEQLVDALINPTYPMYFGRKCCVPSEQIFLCEVESNDELHSKVNTLLGITIHHTINLG